MKRKSAVVIDTNVPLVANHKYEAATKNDVRACVDSLVSARNGLVVLDDSDRILAEYRRQLSPSGQPGVGDRFMKWLWDNRANAEVCRSVVITPTPSDPEDFLEFPQDDRLTQFDRNDRKFVAVAKASNLHPPILNASDSDWWDYENVLADNGVHVKHICPDIRDSWCGRPKRK